MTDGVVNNVMYGVRNDEFEKVGAGSADRYAGEDGLVAQVAKAARLAMRAAEKGTEEQIARAQALLESRVLRLFGEFEIDAQAIEDATGGPNFAYNSLHVSVPNPNHVPPVSTVTENPDGSYTVEHDWTHATRDAAYIDVSAQDVLRDPSLGTQLVVHNDFHL